MAEINNSRDVRERSMRGLADHINRLRGALRAVILAARSDSAIERRVARWVCKHLRRCLARVSGGAPAFGRREDGASGREQASSVLYRLPPPKPCRDGEQACRAL